MDAVEALRAQIRAYLDQRTSLQNLHSWLAAHEIGLNEPLDPAWDDLAAAVWALISERDAGLRDEDAARAELELLLRPRVVVSSTYQVAVRTTAQRARVSVSPAFAPAVPPYSQETVSQETVRI